MREVKFRAWDSINKNMRYDIAIVDFEKNRIGFKNPEKRLVSENYREFWDLPYELMQYTGLKDINCKGCCEVYEGDIITIEGKIRGNIYENEPRKTDIVIPPIGTKAWNTTYKKTLERGFDYAE